MPTAMTEPLTFGTPEQFVACRTLLQEVRYTEERLRERYRLPALSRITARQPRASVIDHPLELLTQLFIDGTSAARSQITALLPPGALESLVALGLLTPNPQNSELWTGTVMLYPRSGLLLVSDRPRSFDGGPVGTVDEARDVVFPALTDNTERFLENLPVGPCQRFLDLGTGTGVAALVAAPTAGHVWAVDVTERSVRFAEFNRRLNGLSNVTVVQGDLYEPVADQMFDRIVIHPPYVPALRQGLIFQDGGVDGQDITRRAVADLPRHLSPGGRFYCLSLGIDRDGVPFEQTVRQWLVPHDKDFDVVFVPGYTIRLDFMARSVALKSGGRVNEATRLEESFRELGIREFVYGVIVVQRHAGPRKAFTVRRQRAADGQHREIDWLVRWETELASRGADWLLEARPLASPHVQLLVTHRMVEGELVPTEYTLQTERPFDMEARANPWMGVLLARSDGTMTAMEHYASLREQQAFPDSVSPSDFARVLAQLVSGGFLHIPGFEPPPNF